MNVVGLGCDTASRTADGNAAFFRTFTTYLENMFVQVNGSLLITLSSAMEVHMYQV